MSGSELFSILGVRNSIPQNKTKIGPHSPKDCCFHNLKRDLQTRMFPLPVHGFGVDENVLRRAPQLFLSNQTQMSFKKESQVMCS